MKVIELGDLNGVDYYNARIKEPPPGDYVGFAIGPMSLVDQVEIDGLIVTAGRFVPLRVQGTPQVKPVRGPRVVGGVFPGPSTTVGASSGQINTRCQLLGYECGDPIVPPGARAPLRLSHAMAIDTDLILRLPFAGRSRARIIAKRTTNPAVGNLEVGGRIYHRRDDRALAVTTGDAYQATGAGAFLTPLVSIQGTGVATLILGPDQVAGFDELEIRISTAGGDIVHVVGEAMDAEPWGAS